MTSNRDLILHQQSHFESVASSYAQTRLANLNHRRFKRLLWHFALRDMHWPKSASVLEPMCGTCDGLEILLSSGLKIQRYEAFDYSKTMVSAAVEQLKIRSLADRRYPKVRTVLIQDICEYESETPFDIAILLGGLHHVYANTAQALIRLQKVLKPGGTLINFEPTHSNPVNQAIREKIYGSNSFFDADTESGYRLREYNLLLDQTGFVILRQMYPGLLLYCFLYNPDAFGSLPTLPPWLLNVLFRAESTLYDSSLARFLSFATITIARRI